MFPFLNQKMTEWQESGKLAIAASLLFELLIVLWLGFIALFSLETLLPTFVTIRISLTNFLTVLILGTILYLFLEQKVDAPLEQNKTPRWLSVGVWCFGALLIALSLARFPLAGAIVFFVGYLALLWLLNRFLQEK